MIGHSTSTMNLILGFGIYAIAPFDTAPKLAPAQSAAKPKGKDGQAND